MSSKKLAKDSTYDGANVPGTALLSKALNIIESIAATSGRLKIKEITEITGYSKPTLYRILSALVFRGMIQQDARDHAYSLGPKFTELAGSIARNTELITVSAQSLKRIAAKFGEVVNLGVLDGKSLQIVARWGGIDGAPMSDIGGRKPLYCTALGKVILAHLPDQRHDRLISGLEFEALTDKTITEETQLRIDLSMIRSRGFALDNEEIITGTNCVAVPILGASGEVLGAASVSGPAFRLNEQRRFDIAADLQKAAETISLSFRHSINDDVWRTAKKNTTDICAVDHTRAFGCVALLPGVEMGKFHLIDGMGAKVISVQDGQHQVIASFGSPIQAGYHLDGMIFVLVDDTIFRVDPAQPGSDPLPYFSNKTFRLVDAITPLANGVLLAGAGREVLSMSQTGECTVVATDRSPRTGLNWIDGGLGYICGPDVVLLPSDGSDQVRRVTTDADVRDFVLTDGQLWVTQSKPWTVTGYTLEGSLVRQVPLPVPQPSVVERTFDGNLMVCSDRITLSSAQLELAPLSGDVFTLQIASPPRSRTHKRR
ncbi:MAG: IclR family transcriptional regulator [Alphaproteobacteria bacterium]|nr:IclR family transcriptional regulator [Alphaproteobacteria bacterium]